MQFSKTVVQRLKTKISFFSNFVEEEIEGLLRLASHRSYKARDVLFREGDEGSEMFVILSGDVRISKLNEDGIDIILAQLSSGDCFGEMSMIDSSKRSATATADSELNVMILQEEVLKHNLALAYKLFKNFSVMMATRLRTLNKNFLDTSAEEAKNKEKFMVVLRKYSEQGGSFENANIRNSSFSKVSFSNVSFKGASLVHGQLEDSKIENSKFEQVMFTGANYKNTEFAQCSFQQANFSAASFSNVVFRDCTFQQETFKYLVNKGVRLVNNAK